MGQHPYNPHSLNNFKKLPFDYTGRLTKKQHLMVFTKAINLFEQIAYDTIAGGERRERSSLSEVSDITMSSELIEVD